MLDVAHYEVARHAGALGHLADGALPAIVVRGLLSAGVASRAAERLEADPSLVARREPRDVLDRAVPQVEVIGEPISPSAVVPTGPRPAVYFERAEAFAALEREVFEGSLFARLEGALCALAGAPVRRASAGSRPYGHGTLRRVPPGCAMDVHCENLYASIEVLHPLAHQVDLDRVLSFFVVVAAPAEGGEVELWGSRRPARDEAGMQLAPGLGDLLVFPGGARFHRVRRVGGSSPRWTAGGFCAPRLDGEGFLRWG